MNEAVRAEIERAFQETVAAADDDQLRLLAAINTWRHLYGDEFTDIALHVIEALGAFTHALATVGRMANATPEQLEEMRQSVLELGTQIQDQGAGRAV